MYCGHRYDDARAAIAWLKRAFGFEEQAVYAEGEQIAHAQLRFGNDLFMTGSAHDDIFRFTAPRALGGRVTHVVFGYVDDPVRHFAQATAAGAEAVRPPADEHGARSYVVRDPEGFRWCFGTFRPSCARKGERVVTAPAD